MTVQVQDHFTDVNGTALDAHTPDVDVVGGGWSEIIGTNWTIQSNTANTTAGDGTAAIDCGAADINLSCEADSNALSSAAIQSAGLCARLSDSLNFWAIIINDSGNSFRISEKNGGTYTDRASASVTINGGTLYTLTAQLSGQTITAQIDGGNEISYGSATLNETVTVHGIKARRPGDRIDDFLAETTGGGTEYTQSVGGSQASAGALARQANVVKAGSAASAGTVARLALKALAGAQASASTLVRQTNKLLAGAQAASGALLRQVIQFLAGAQATAGTLAQLVSKPLAATQPSEGALASVKVAVLTLSGAMASAGATARLALKALAGGQAAAGTLAHLVSKRLAGDQPSSGALAAVKVAVLSLAGTMASAGALVRQALKAVSGTQASGGALGFSVARLLSGDQASAGALSKLASRSVGGTLSSAGSLAAQVINALVRIVELLFGLRRRSMTFALSQRSIEFELN